MPTPPLIVHIIYRLDIGGLENGLVNLINRMPPERYRHAIICLTDHSSFRSRIQRDDVACYALHKRIGKDLWMFWRLFKLLRQLKPAIVHTRNLATLECVLPAALAGVRCRVHGEHGRDVEDMDGSSVKLQWLRRFFKPFVSRYIPLSRDLEAYLHEKIGVPPERMTQIYNGVDSDKFRPPVDGRESLPVADFAGPGSIVVGTVGRMQIVKDQLTLVRAFLQVLKAVPDVRKHLRLVLVGEGPLRAVAENILAEADALQLAWLPGARHDIPELLRGLDVFVLPSLAEGISNTILEAMATGLPVVATHVGGNPELVEDGVTGTLVPASDPMAMAAVIADYFLDAGKRQCHGKAAREMVERKYSMDAMVAAYMGVYDRVLAAH